MATFKLWHDQEPIPPAAKAKALPLEKKPIRKKHSENEAAVHVQRVLIQNAHLAPTTVLPVEMIVLINSDQALKDLSEETKVPQANPHSKEVVLHSIHRISPCSESPMVKHLEFVQAAIGTKEILKKEKVVLRLVRVKAHQTSRF